MTGGSEFNEVPAFTDFFTNSGAENALASRSHASDAEPLFGFERRVVASELEQLEGKRLWLGEKT